MDFYTLDGLKVEGKKVIVRCEFNVPIDKEGNITDDFRIKKSLPTIKYLLDNGAKQVVLMSHLGKPKGVVIDILKMNRVASRLQQLLGVEVIKVDDSVDITLPDSRIILLENLRFNPGEKENREEFAKKLASYADIYVNDAFGTCHRSHASVDAITKYLPSVAGFLVEKEVEMLSLEIPDRPFVAVLGCAKISDKIKMIENLLSKVDVLLLGGAIVFTFLKAKGLEIGKSLVEDEQLQTAKDLLYNRKIVLPTDIVVSNEISENSKNWVVKAENIPKDAIGLDIGPDSIQLFSNMIKTGQTIFWNGPVGVFEVPPYDNGTKELAKIITNTSAKTIVGGGDTASAVRHIGLDERFSHVSTGGGASIEMIQGNELPGIKALIENKKNFIL
ncbi:phosphoglycerate kinase [Candidatus Woesearchaeota archaeon]|nr:MAG: phosphoglycerate kinase [Candidatus Woesearchaeota archaeon]